VPDLYHPAGGASARFVVRTTKQAREPVDGPAPPPRRAPRRPHCRATRARAPRRSRRVRPTRASGSRRPRAARAIRRALRATTTHTYLFPSLPLIYWQHGDVWEYSPARRQVAARPAAGAATQPVMTWVTEDMVVVIEVGAPGVWIVGYGSPTPLSPRSYSDSRTYKHGRGRTAVLARERIRPMLFIAKAPESTQFRPRTLRVSDRTRLQELFISVNTPFTRGFWAKIPVYESCAAGLILGNFGKFGAILGFSGLFLHKYAVYTGFLAL